MARFSAFKNSRKVSQDGLFDLPIPIALDSIYAEMNLDPSAVAEEVAEGVKALNDRRQAEKTQLDEKIKATESQIPGLREAYEEWTRTQASQNADERVLPRLTALESRALDIDPDFQENRRKSKELGERIDSLNALDLKSVAGLAKYDEAHPPFAVMKLAPATRDEFLEQARTELWVLRRDITRFLERKGETVEYASDLDREDFTGDFCRNPILDGDE